MKKLVPVWFSMVWLMLAAATANADTYPTKPIRLVMPYPGGGGGDMVLRPLIEKLYQGLGQRFVIDYKPGASTIIGTEIVAKSAPDGYTIGFVTDSHSLNPIFRKDLPYDSLNDFAPVSQLVGVPLVLVAHPSAPFKTVPELVAHAKANPGKLAYASLGFGGPHYILMEWLKTLAGIDVLHVPYQGSSASLTAGVAGQVQLMFTGASTALQYSKDNRLRMIASAPSKRLPVTPDLPAIAETYKEFDFSNWYGLVAPAKTPPEIVARLSDEVGKALRSPDLNARLLSIGLIPAPSTPQEFSAFLRRDAEHYARVIKVTGARGE